MEDDKNKQNNLVTINYLNILMKWKKELIISYAVLAVIFALYFYNEILRALIMSASAFVFVLIPGTLFVSYIFPTFKKHEKLMVGFGCGIVLSPFLIYLINIFEVLHAKYLAFIVPILIIGIMIFLHDRKMKK